MTLLDGWVSTLAPHHHDLKRLELTAAKDAKESRIGWYVAPSFKDWKIGKMTIGHPITKFAVVRDDGSPLLFPSVENALEFYRKELGVFGVAMFQA